MKKLKDNVKKILIGGLIIVALTAPIFRVNCSDGDILVKHYSIVTSLIEDVKEGSFMTPGIVYGNIHDRIVETYNDIVYR